MGVDVYVGPLTRYIAGDWKNLVQQAAEQMGVPYRRVTPAGLNDPLPPLDEAHAAAIRWRESLAAVMGVREALDWDESPQSDYFTDRVNWDGYWALWFFAAHQEFPEIPAPETIPVPHELFDPADQPLAGRVEEVYRGKSSGLLGRLFRRDRGSVPAHAPRYPHLLGDAHMWVPVEFQTPVAIGGGEREPTLVASLPRLLAELEALNDATVKGSPADLREWRNADLDLDRSLDTVAKFGLSIFLEGARYGVERRLPMVLDF